MLREMALGHLGTCATKACGCVRLHVASEEDPWLAHELCTFWGKQSGPPRDFCMCVCVYVCVYSWCVSEEDTGYPGLSLHILLPMRQALSVNMRQLVSRPHWSSFLPSCLLQTTLFLEP